MSGHLPECPTTTDPHGLDDGYACPCECQCEILRACEERVRMEDDDYAYVAAQAEADGRWRGWTEALNAAREAVAALCNHSRTIPTGWCCGHALAAAAIDDLRVTDKPTTSPAKAKPADLHDPQWGEMIH